MSQQVLHLPEIKKKVLIMDYFSLVENEYDNISDNPIWDKSTLVDCKKIELEEKNKIRIKYISFY